MILTEFNVKQDDGSFNTTWKLSQEQVQVLLNVAVQILIAQGLAEVIKEYVDKDGHEIDPRLLASLSAKDLPQA